MNVQVFILCASLSIVFSVQTVTAQLKVIDTLYFELGSASIEAETIVKLRTLLSDDVKSVFLLPEVKTISSIDCYENNVYQRRADCIQSFIGTHHFDSLNVYISYHNNTETLLESTRGTRTIVLTSRKALRPPPTFNEITWALRWE